MAGPYVKPMLDGTAGSGSVKLGEGGPNPQGKPAVETKEGKAMLALAETAPTSEPFSTGVLNG